MAQRLFFSMPLTRSSQIALLKLQAQLSEQVPQARIVPAANFHLTLAFLGNVNAEQKAQLLRRWATLCPPSITLNLNKLSYWPKAQVLCAEASITPQPLAQLAYTLRHDAREHGLYHSPHDFRPHVSLFRGVTMLNGELPPLEPLSLAMTQVDLMQSVLEYNQVRYHRLQRWPSSNEPLN